MKENYEKKMKYHQDKASLYGLLGDKHKYMDPNMFMDCYQKHLYHTNMCDHYYKKVKQSDMSYDHMQGMMYPNQMYNGMDTMNGMMYPSQMYNGMSGSNY